MKGYEQTRDRNRHLAEQRRREIYTKLPEYGRLDESVGELSVAQAKLLLNGDDEALIKGVMIESYIEEGNQKIGDHIYGKSITDPCLGWEDSRDLIYTIADMCR